MAEVGGGDDGVVADRVDAHLDARVVRVGRDVALPLPVFDRLHLEARDAQIAAAAGDARLYPVHPEGHPSRARFEVDDAKLRMPLQHATGDQRQACHDVAYGEGREAAADRPVREVIRPNLSGRRARAHVHAQRHVQLLQRVPERVVKFIEQGNVVHRLWVDRDRVEAVFLDALPSLARG